jgi:hypothetical protein
MYEKKTLRSVVCNICQKECTRWSDDPRPCDCGGTLHRKYGGNFTNAGDYYHVSESLGILPEQAEEHRKQWPNVEVLPDGKVAFRSVKEQERYSHHFGMDKKVQKLR